LRPTRPSKKPPPTRDRALAAFERLRTYVETRANLAAEEFGFIRTLFAPRHLAKGEVLQQAGEPARYMVFVAGGCLRRYVIDARGKVHILGFAPEDWWVSDPASLMSGEPSTFFVDAIEASDLLLIDHASHQRILDTVPRYAAAHRVGLERLAAARDKRMVSALSASAEERYLDFLATYPTLLPRVPQRMVASYLGMSPETLSRIRKRLATQASAGTR
jgi:CRP/FNR family transcriptional regulator, anaerobic regulatory protein